jgi:RimJ/RimL family protein N-acetyltransferase
MCDSTQAEAGPDIVLETGRLRLRRCVPQDIDRLVELDSDPEVMRYVTFGVPTPRERYEREILPRWFALYAVNPLLAYWVAERRADGGFVGWFHLRPDRFDAGELELGYRLRRAAWRQGLATEGSLGVLAHGFERVGAEIITARTLAANVASQRVMQKCGLQFERDFTYPEDVVAGRTEAERAAVKYSITRSAWLARRA